MDLKKQLSSDLPGKLPDKEELSRFLDMMSDMEELGGRFDRDVVMKGTSQYYECHAALCSGSLYI